MQDKIEDHQINLEQILNNSPDGVFTISPDLDIRYVNPAFCRILGFTAEELIGTKVLEYLGDLSIQEACDKEIQDHGYCHDQETIFKRKDGSMVHISKNVQAICDDDGNFKEILVTIRDLSELHGLNKELTKSKKQLEENNLHLQKMLEDLQTAQQQLVEAEKLASLGGLVAGVAHEINTPLGISVTSASSMHMELDELKEKFTGNSLKKTELETFFDRAGQACKILNTNLRRAAELVRSFKQVAVDQVSDDIRRINLNDYVNEVLVSIGPSYKHTGITLDSECDPEINLDTHPGALYQVISNLVINSITHAFDKGAEGKISLKFYRDDGNVVFDFSDNGKGISEENRKEIFTPFFTTRRGSGGSGLGLSIVYNLVTARLKGAIKVESTEGVGTNFNIVFPQVEISG